MRDRFIPLKLWAILLRVFEPYTINTGFVIIEQINIVFWQNRLLKKSD